MRSLFRILILCTLLGAVGCGKDAVAGGQKEVEVVAVGDGTTSGSASTLRSGGAPGVLPAARYSVALPEGTITFTATVSLIAETGGTVPLTQAFHTVQVRIDGRQPIVETLVPETRYARVRVVFSSVEAEIASGLPGVSGKVRVAIPQDQPLVVEREVPLTDPERRDVVVVDLNASAWLAAAVGEVVPGSTFGSAVRIRAE